MIRTLVSVPPAFDHFLRSAGSRPRGLVVRDDPLSYVGSDPGGLRLGSGGGTVALLHAAWRATRRSRQPLRDWLSSAPSLVLHAGGESRRLPAYAAIGKAMLPVPPLDQLSPHRYDQTLADFQLPHYRQILREAGRGACALVASGDVWLEFDPLQIPAVSNDITGIGMRVSPEVAQHFGVYFVAKTAPAPGVAQPIAFFRQKPPPQLIYRHLARYDFFVDTGLWFLSRAAVQRLFGLCGWDEGRQRFHTRTGYPKFLDLYSDLGPGLGSAPPLKHRLRRPRTGGLTASIIPLPQARFFHLGSNRQLFESFAQLAARNGGATCHRSASPAPNIMAPARAAVWLDNVATASPVTLDGLNLLTGVPAAAGPLRLGREQCLDIVPIGRRDFVVRPYALDDTLRGDPRGGAKICGLEAAPWLAQRRLPADRADVFEIPVYPIVAAKAITQDLLDWFFATTPDPRITKVVLRAQRLSAAEIPFRMNFRRHFAGRSRNQAAALLAELKACRDHGDIRVFAQDFDAVARQSREPRREIETWLIRQRRAVGRRITRPEYRSRLSMLLAQFGGRTAPAFAAEAYKHLQTAIVSSAQLSPARPRLALKEDQIVWGRSPVRLDLAGGWTDTPPYCLEFGGAVVNVAVLLNGQPPIQVFVRPVGEPVIRLRSIDLGVGEVVSTYAALSGFRDPRSGFSLPKAALALAGFLPEFAIGTPHSTLKERLRSFGSGLEISLLSAVPKGSGLGTSSILGATLLAALNRACALGWDEISLYNRVLAVEQLLTTGGGWQDQAGALFRGLKLVQTTPGSAQTPSVRYLPSHLFDADHANHTLLLYYTGITRLAKGILKEIVQDMFLGRFETLQTLNLIRQNALNLSSSIQEADATGLSRCIARSWDLNKRLDPGTSTPAIERLLAQCGDDLAAAKLLGAGGGGYMLLCARDIAAGRRIKDRLEKRPPNPRARFIEFQLAERSLQVTVS